MIGAGSAFGYSVPLAVLRQVVALLIGLALGVLFCLTVGLSGYRSVRERRRRRVREELQAQLLDGVFDPDTDWARWIEDRSATERDVIESLLDEYLRELDGEAVVSLRRLGAALGIPDRSRRQLDRDGEYTRLRALTWLTLLDRPDTLREAAFRPRTPRERASVARLRHESGRVDDPRADLSLLLDGVTAQFTAFGQDTLYRVATEDPEGLFALAATNHRAWSEPLLIQVLAVCRHLGASVTTEDLSWLTAMLEHERPTVRAAAARALETLGWRRDVRDSPFLDRLVRDPSPQVRAAVYRTLAEWGDTRALGVLQRGIRSEDDPRARLAGTDALARCGARLDGAVPPTVAGAMAWSTEQTAYDDSARQRRTRVSD